MCLVNYSVPHSQQVAEQVCLPDSNAQVLNQCLLSDCFVSNFFPLPHKFILNSSARLIVLKCYFHCLTALFRNNQQLSISFKQRLYS